MQHDRRARLPQEPAPISPPPQQPALRLFHYSGDPLVAHELIEYWKLYFRREMGQGVRKSNDNELEYIFTPTSERVECFIENCGVKYKVRYCHQNLILKLN